jgi:hypothetical protein
VVSLLGGLLEFLPALLLVVVLVLARRRRLPGEDLLIRVARRSAARRVPRVRRVARRAAVPRRPDRLRPAGGVLLAFSLAGRAPPAGR